MPTLRIARHYLAGTVSHAERGRQKGFDMHCPDLLFHPDVAAAIDGKRGLVALESTVIAHGLPWPANLDTARDVEAAVRAEGAVPATIAVLQGAPHIGLYDAEIGRAHV